MKILNNPNIKRIHCIGIGGIGVSGLAEILIAKGYQVSGSDMSENRMTRHLQSLGVQITLGHQADNIRGVDAVVYSSAITAENPEFLAAKLAGIPLIKRGEMLAELMDLSKNAIAIAGTHGKTTTTSLATYVLLENKLNPTFMIGGILNHLQSPAQLGGDNYFVAESDESDASFLYLNPKIAIVTNIDKDHLETYQEDFECLKQAFLKFLQKIPNDGLVILNNDDVSISQILSQINKRVITYGLNKNADISLHDYSQQGLKSRFKVTRRNNSKEMNVELNLPGIHNAMNALAVIALAQELRIPDQILLTALANFPGVGRRFYAHGELPVHNGSALLFDDYGHHPNEIKATLAAARLAWPDRRLVLVFQPHRYSRTRDLMNEFAEVLNQTDLLLLLEIYSAGEIKIPGVDGATLCQKVIKKGKLQPVFIADMNELPQTLKNVLQAGDIVLFQGAGSIGPLAATIGSHEIFKA